MVCPGYGATDDQGCRRECPEVQLAINTHVATIRVVPGTDTFELVDAYGDVYQLRLTHVPHDPIRITPVRMS